MSYIDYAIDVVEGKIVACEFVRLSCKRFLDDLQNHDYYLNTRKVELFVKFAMILKHIKGKFAGQSVEFQPWQLMIAASIFGIYRRDNNRRKYIFSYIEVPRKSGKSFFAAVMCLFALICDNEPGAEVLVAANSAKQAMEVDYDTIAKLAKQLDPTGKDLRIYRDSVKIAKTASKLIVLAADSSRMDGFNCSFGLIDEYHEAPDSSVSDVIRSSMGMRENPHLCTITTAGFNLSGPCKDLRDYSIDVLKGIKQDESLYAIIYTLDEGDDWTDESNWMKASPNLGLTVDIDSLRATINRAIQNPSDEVETKTKHLNIWCSSSNVWIPESVIKKSMQPVDLSEYKEWVCYLGMDLAAVSDLTALSFMFVNQNNDEYVFKTFYYLPKSALDGKFNSELYKIWSRKGYLILTDSKTTDYNYIKNQILYWFNILDIRKISYDAWNSTQLINDLLNEGLPMEPYSQSIGNFNIPTKELERLLLEDRCILDNNPINRFCFDNVELKIDINGNCKPIGDHQSKKIDGVISKITALGGYLKDVYQDNYQAFVLPTN